MADVLDRLAAADPVGDAAAHLVVPALAELEAGWGPDPARSERALPGEPRARRARWRRHGGGFLSIALAGLVAAGAASATLTAVTGDPLGRVESTAVEPAGGTERIASVTAEDPGGGPPWTVRIGRADPGLVCLGVGQLQAGKLGIVGLDRRFRESAVGDDDQCAVAPTGDRILAAARTFVGGGNTSVVYGIAGPDVKELKVGYVDGAVATLPLDPGGAFVVARRSSITVSAPQIITQGTDKHGHYARIVQLGDLASAKARRGGRPVQVRPLDPKEPVR